MARLCRLAGVTALALAALFFLSVLALWIFLSTESGQQVLRRQLVSVVRSSIAADIQVGSVGGILGRSVELRHVRVAVGGQTVARIPRMLTEYAPLELLRGRILLRRVTIESPWVRLERANGRWVVPGSAGGSRQALGIPVHIQSLEILGGRVAASWREAGSWRRMAAADLHLELSAIVEPDVQEIRVLRLAFVPRGIALSPVRASGTAVREAGRSICLVDVELATSRSRLSMYGCVDPANAVSARLALDPLDAGEARAIFAGSDLSTNVVATVAARGPWHATRVALRADLGVAGELSSQVRLDLESQPPRYHATVDLIQLDPHAAFARGIPLSLNGRFRVRGGGFDEDANARWRGLLGPLEVAGRRVSKLRLAGRSARGTHVLAGRVEGPAGTAGMRGRVSLAPVLAYELVSRIQVESLAAVVPGVSGSGAVVLSLSGHGTEPGNREADLRGTITAAAVAGVSVDHARLHARLDGERFSVESFRVGGPGLRAELHGSMDLPTRTIDLVLDGTLGLRSLGAALDPPVAGTLEAAASARGPLEALAVDACVTGSALAWRSARAEEAKVSLHATGIGGHEPAASAEARIAGLRVGGGEPRTATGNLSWMRTTQGDDATVSARARMGDTTTEQVNLSVTRTGGAMRGEIRELLLTPLGDGVQWHLAQPASFVVEKGLSAKSVTLRADGQQVTLEGRLSSEGKNDASICLRQVNMAPICVAVGLPDCAGRLSADATVSGTAAAPVLRGTLSAEGLSVKSVDYGGLNLAAVYKDRVLSVEAALLTPVAGTVDLEAALPIDLAWTGSRQDMAREPLRAGIHADALSLAFLPMVAPREVQSAEGNIAVDIRLTGTRTAPHAEGRIALDGGSLEIAGLGCRYGDVSAQLEARGSRLHVTDLHAKSGAGTLHGTGWVELEGEGGLQLSLMFQMDEFLAVKDRRYEVVLGGDVRFSGSPEAPEVTGSLEVVSARLRLPGFMPSTDPRGQPDPTIEVVGESHRSQGQGGAEPSQKSVLNGPLRVGLDVRVGGNAWIRREDLNVEIAGEFRIEKDPYQEPAVHGRLTLRRGWYAFQGRRFNVREGTITFSGKGTDPHIDVTGSYRAGKYMVLARVAGTSSKPNLELSSEPPLDQADVLAVLLFGKPSEQLTGGQAAGLQQQTIALASGYAIGELSSSVRDALGLDTLEVQIPGGSGSEGGVTVGRYVTRDVFVSLAQEFGQSIAEVVSVEYFITPKISIRGSTSSLGNSTVDVLVSHRY